MNIIQQDNYIFLNVNGRWFKYDSFQAPIGSGAMGEVYLGTDCETGVKVAIKKVLDAYSNIPSIRERARLEASLMFRHRNLVEMLGFCEYEEHYGPIFIISKFVMGMNMDKFIDKFLPRVPSATPKICQMFLPVLDALDYIHSKNILHLDIKPSNIMIENGRNVRLMDLGIALCNDRESDLGQGMMGTPKYAAPEQLSSDTSAQLSVRTDIYEAGVTLYELLTGQNPYSGVDIRDIREKHKFLLLPPHRHVSPALLKVLRKATMSNPMFRYSSAREFRSAIQSALIAPPPEKEQDSWWIWGLVGLVACLLICFAIFFIYG